MTVTRINPALLPDTEVAEQFFAAINAVAEIMNKADAQGLTCNFNIGRDVKGKFILNQASITKIIKEKK